jgi:hypothetical protein
MAWADLRSRRFGEMKFKLLFLLLAVLMVGPVCLQAADDRLETAVAQVNGEAITLREFRAELLAVSGDVYAQIERVFHLPDGDDFWNQPLAGGTPLQRARRVALDNCVKRRVQLQLAKAHGLLIDTSYADLLVRLERENAERKATVARGGVIYGPRQYGERDYLEYWFSNLVLRLKEKLSVRETRVEDEDVAANYLANRETRFRRAGTNEGSPEYLGLEEVKESLRSELADQKYDALIARLTSEAKVESFPLILDSVPIR